MYFNLKTCVLSIQCVRLKEIVIGRRWVRGRFGITWLFRPGHETVFIIHVCIYSRLREYCAAGGSCGGEEVEKESWEISGYLDLTQRLDSECLSPGRY